MSCAIDLCGKTILVTGASSGLGRAAAHVFDQLGARLVLSGRRVAELERTKAHLREPGMHLVAPFDLAEIDKIPDWLRTLKESSGAGLNGLFHAAGIHAVVPARSTKPAQVEQIIRINTVAAICLLTGLAKENAMLDEGSIVMVSSVAGLVGEPGLVVYGASKAALFAAVRAAATEFACRRIRVNCLTPGMIDLGMTSSIKDLLGDEGFARVADRHLLGIGRAEDVIMPAAFLLSDLARWITGTSLVVDGGYSVR